MTEHDAPCDYAKTNRHLLDKGHQRFEKVDERLQKMELAQTETKVMTEIMFRKFMDEKTIKSFDANRNPDVDEKTVLENFNKESVKRQKLIKLLIKLTAILTGIALIASSYIAFAP